MKSIQRVAFIGNHLPRRCGIATFTHDLHLAGSTARPDLETCVVAMTDLGCTYDYPPAVRFQIHDENAAPGSPPRAPVSIGIARRAPTRSVCKSPTSDNSIARFAATHQPDEVSDRDRRPSRAPK
jgi:hypothetical protein